MRGNAEATVAAKDKAASRFLGYLDEAGAGDLAALGVRDVSGFFLRQRGLRRKTIAAMRSSLADFLAFLAAAGQTPQNLAGRLPPHRHVRHESEPHLRAVTGRQSAAGKRDYVMILMTARLGLRISDLRQPGLGDLDWRAKTITIVQHKTGLPLSLPLPATSAGRSPAASGTAAPKPPARRCSSSTATPSTRSGAPRRSPAGCRATLPARESTSRRTRRTGCIPCAVAGGFLYGGHLRSSTVRRNELAVRQLTEYAQAAGCDACTPAGTARVRVRHQPPYVLAGDEVRRLLAAIDSQAMSSYSNKAMAGPVLFRVLYGAGLRLSEALSLTLADVDTRSGTLRIRDSKNGESRTVPVTGRLTATLDSYIAAAHPAPETSDYVFYSAAAGGPCATKPAGSRRTSGCQAVRVGAASTARSAFPFSRPRAHPAQLRSCGNE